MLGTAGATGPAETMTITAPAPQVDTTPPDTDRRRDRWSMWRWLRDHSTRAGARECMTPREGEVTLGVTGGGAVHVAGVKRCGSVWACPHCAGVKRERAATAIDELLRRALDAGCELRFLTVTVQHHMHHSLDHLGEALQACYSVAFSGRAAQPGRETITTEVPADVDGNPIEGPVWPWESHRTVRHVEEVRASWYWGQVRALDLTDGVNGWHPHIHTVLVFAPGTSSEQIDDWMRARRAKYRWALRAWGLYSAADQRGWDVRDVRSYDNPGDAVGRYVTKVDGGWGAGLELARMDLKTGHGRTPFQLLRAAAIDGETRARLRFLEYERWSTGRKLTVTSRRLTGIFGIDPDELVDDSDGDAEVAPDDLIIHEHRIPADCWWRLAVKLQVPALIELVLANAHNAGYVN